MSESPAKVAIITESAFFHDLTDAPVGFGKIALCRCHPAGVQVGEDGNTADLLELVGERGGTDVVFFGQCLQCVPLIVVILELPL